MIPIRDISCFASEKKSKRPYFLTTDRFLIQFYPVGLDRAFFRAILKRNMRLGIPALGGRLLFVSCMLLFAKAGALAASINLFDHALNINGTISQGGSPVASVNTDGFDFSTGLGTLSVEVNSAGNNYAGFFVDHDIDEAANTFFNEFGATSGTVPLDLSWEIDEPGYVFGDIYWNFLAGALDNTAGVGPSAPDDVSMAMAWDFVLNAGEIAKINFILSDTAPTSGPAIGFHLAHSDPDSPQTIYFSSSLEIISGPVAGVPDAGSTAILLGAGVLGCIFFGRSISSRADRAN